MTAGDCGCRELEAILESSYDGIVICDAGGVILQVNSAYERITEIPRSVVVGRTGRELTREGILSDYLADRVLASRQPTLMIQRYRTGRSAVVIGSPVFDEGGHIVRIVFNVRDVTEIVTLKQELSRSQQATERFQAEVRQLRAEQGVFEDIVVASRAMQGVVHLVLAVARVDSTVLLTGESGVGKGILARAIHRHSPRAEGPFIAVNCAALPESLLEAELFGYEPGAFTGARREGKPGLVELADGGTLFLDEVSEMSLSVQARFLQFLQEREFRRVGGTVSRRVDVRVIAATNRDLEERVRQGLFRADLYWRLNVVPIAIPPLRERPEDILALATRVLQRVNSRYGFSRHLTNEALTALMGYSWPGNVRELENLIERLAVTADGDAIGVEQLPPHIRTAGPDRPAVVVQELVPLAQAFAEVERQLYELAARRHRTTRRVAQALGVSQPTAARKLRRYRHASRQSDDSRTNYA